MNNIKLKDYVAMIKDAKLHNWTIEVIEKYAPDYFWTSPCSSSGKYHPWFDNVEGGGINHIVACIFWGKELANVYETTQYLDCVISALILHDLWRFGQEEWDGSDRHKDAGWTEAHGYRLAEFLRKEYRSEMNNDISRVITAIGCHMGKWSKNEQWQTKDIRNDISRRIAETVQMADYCASRKYDQLLKEFEER